LASVAWTLACIALLTLSVRDAQADDSLWQRIASEENIVVLTRHMQSAGTNPLAWDESGACRGEHILTAQGREDAAALGRLFRERSIRPVVISSPMCRCVETAKIAFGEFIVDPALREVASGDAARTREFNRVAAALLAKHRGRAPVVFVSHRPNIDQVTMELLDENDLLVGKIDGEGRVEVIGRMHLTAR
jgi:broad specificity phosphatase PhoE